MDVVWLKRDARILDHGPLSVVGVPPSRPFLVLFVYEPDQLSHHTVFGGHIQFHNECLWDLDVQLAALHEGKATQSQSQRANGHHGFYAQPSSSSFSSPLPSPRPRALTLGRGEMTRVLQHIHTSPHGPIIRLLSHQETGHWVSYQRDKRVKKWCRCNRIHWLEFQNQGVIRGLKDRNQFSSKASAFLAAPLFGTVSAQTVRQKLLVLREANTRVRGNGQGNNTVMVSSSSSSSFSSSSPSPSASASASASSLPPQGTPTQTKSPPRNPSAPLESDAPLLLDRFLPSTDLPEVIHQGDYEARQLGGEREALHVLSEFLNTRSVGYSRGISSPLSSWTSCSRLSPHLTWGSLSVRYTFHRLSARRRELQDVPNKENNKDWIKNLYNFQSRLRWRSHFIQKLESQPEMEFTNQCRAYDVLRDGEEGWNQELYEKWINGRTGYPFVDACMRCLRTHGW